MGSFVEFYKVHKKPGTYKENQFCSSTVSKILKKFLAKYHTCFFINAIIMVSVASLITTIIQSTDGEQNGHLEISVTAMVLYENICDFCW